jgi:hypothetical protein
MGSTRQHRQSHRLAALRAGEPVDVQARDLPAWAWVGVEIRWWTCAAVSPDGGVVVSPRTPEAFDDGARKWLEEQGL